MKSLYMIRLIGTAVYGHNGTVSSFLSATIELSRRKLSCFHHRHQPNRKMSVYQLSGTISGSQKLASSSTPVPWNQHCQRCDTGLPHLSLLLSTFEYLCSSQFTQISGLRGGGERGARNLRSMLLVMLLLITGILVLAVSIGCIIVVLLLIPHAVIAVGMRSQEEFSLCCVAVSGSVHLQS